MKTVQFDLPALYGDHHVIEVRRILLQIPGVEDVTASSAFHMVEVCFDPVKVDEQAIAHALEETGYLGDLNLPVETGKAAYQNGGNYYYRHAEVFETTRQMGFVQAVSNSSRPLWNCPGLGVIKNEMED